MLMPRAVDAAKGVDHSIHRYLNILNLCIKVNRHFVPNFKKTQPKIA